jgi:archaemetzincin
VRTIDVLPIGPVPEEVLRAVEFAATETFGLETRRLQALPHPAFAWDAERSQHASTAILKDVFARRTPDAVRVLAVTEADIFLPMLTFVFGQAQLGGDAALISLARLRQEFYRLPPDRPLLLARAVKEALHELGHTFGIVHCPDPACAMSLSSDIRQIDAKNAGLCPGCSALLEESLARAGVERASPVPKEEHP